MRVFLIFCYIFIGTAFSWGNVSLRVGDVLLQPTECWSCNLIEAEEGSIYSHMGVIVSVKPLMVAEALDKVKAVSLKEFGAKTQKGQKLLVLRFKDPEIVRFYNSFAQEFYDLFSNSFEGKLYDHDFLWDNFDEQGSEKLYCSEFVTKMIAAFSGVEFPVKRMMFAKYPELWHRYFKGKVPIGKWGNSPGDFEKSALFEHLGEI